jgi:hypothetical protein
VEIEIPANFRAVRRSILVRRRFRNPEGSRRAMIDLQGILAAQGGGDATRKTLGEEFAFKLLR